MEAAERRLLPHDLVDALRAADVTRWSGPPR